MKNKGLIFSLLAISLLVSCSEGGKQPSSVISNSSIGSEIGSQSISSEVPSSSVTTSSSSSNSSISSTQVSSGTVSSSASTSVSKESYNGEVDISGLSSSVKSYYSTVDFTLRGEALKTSLHKKINSHTNVGYDGLKKCYPTTDVRADGSLWDMYSNVKFKTTSGTCGNYSKEGDCWNREHSIPQSWFNEESTLKADLFHVYPTDGYVNGKRSNYPYGEVKNPTYTSGNGSKLGSSSFSGYSGVVFEPIDEYKGDFARTYFYMATCYQNKNMAQTNQGQICFNASQTFPTLTQYSINLFLKWAEEDPVSKKEIDRNNAAYTFQKNRNPFIDVPDLANAIWDSLRTIR